MYINTYLSSQENNAVKWLLKSELNLEGFEEAFGQTKCKGEEQKAVLNFTVH